MAQESPAVIYEKKDQIAYLTINRPERMNALGRAVSKGLLESVWDFRNDPEMRVLILTGAGERGFCAGGDLKEAADRSHSGESEEPTVPSMPIFETLLTTYDKPTIAAVNGVAVGGGCELSLCCDIRVGTPNARIGIMEGRVGRKGHYGTIFLPRYIPMGIALRQLFTGEPLTAQEAERWGLYDKIVSHEELIPYCTQLAEQILLCAPLTVARQKHNAYKSYGVPIPYAFDLEAGPDTLEEDSIEGARAFAEKRKPVWKGKVKPH